jgi:ribosome biogenesis GTPase / thiamine phosphate phosphatase
LVVEELSLLGWSPFFERDWSRREREESVPARVAAEHRSGYEVWSATGECFAELSGRLRHDPGEAGFPAVGDWVLLARAPAGGQLALVERVLPRQSCLVRSAAGREARAQVVAANVDRVFVVVGLDADFNLRRIERYLARIHASGAEPAVILSKADLCADRAARIREVEARCPGMSVQAISALQGEGVAAILAGIAAGRTIALVGSSGAGKSTLVNALAGRELLATGAVRERDGRGCHVTTHRQLVMLPGGGLLIDTPGMRELALIDEDGLSDTFSEIAELAARCRFGDCRHDREPGCAVRAAISAGTLAEDRLGHFLKLEQEARAHELRHDVRRRRAAERAFSRFARVVQRDKRRWRG